MVKSEPGSSVKDVRMDFVDNIAKNMTGQSEIMCKRVDTVDGSDSGYFVRPSLAPQMMHHLE